MTRLLLEPVAKEYDRINFIPDERSKKVIAGEQMVRYLQKQLKATKDSIIVNIEEKDSDKIENLQFADMIAGLIHDNFEDKRQGPWQTLQPYIQHQRLFF